MEGSLKFYKIMKNKTTENLKNLCTIAIIYGAK